MYAVYGISVGRERETQRQGEEEKRQTEGEESSRERSYRIEGEQKLTEEIRGGREDRRIDTQWGQRREREQ